MNQLLKYGMMLGLLIGHLQMVFAQAAAPLCLAVSDQGITVVVLEGKINEVNLGSDDYVAKINQNYLLLKSRKPQVAPTSLFVTYNNHEQFLHATLTYAPEPPETYDLRTSLTPADSLGAAPESKAQQGKNWVAPQVLKRIEALALLPQQYKDLGVRRDQLTAILTHIVADPEYFYLQLFIENKASAAFEVEEVAFCYVSGAQERIQITPIVVPLEEVVLAHSHQTWIYVLPSYALKQKDQLEIDFWEKKGARHVQLIVPSSILLTSLYEAS